MKPAPSLLPLLRSQTQGELLARLYLSPEREYSLTELADATGASLPTIMREADRLAGGGLIDERRSGNQRLIRARTDTPLFRPLTDLLAATYGPVPLLSGVLADVAGVEEAYIYGSWAARYHQSPGGVPADVDVLVVGTADADELYEAAELAQRRLGREVNIRQVSPCQWHEDADDPFLTSVRERPLVPLDLRRG